LFGALNEAPEGLPASTALRQLEARVPATTFEEGQFPGGGRRYDKIVRFATIDCVKAGWLAKQKGVWTVTEAGQQAYQTYTDPETFYRQAVKLYHVWKASQPRSPADAGSGTQSDDMGSVEDAAVEQSSGVTFEQAYEQAWGEIERYLHAMGPYDFQHLVADLLKAMGYHIAWVSPPGKDGGVDVVAHNDPLGTRPPSIKVQVKRVAQRVTLDGVKAFAAVLDDDNVGLFVSAGGFTKDADEYARSHAKRRITLVNLEQLVDLWIEFYTRLEDTARRRLPLTPIHFLKLDA